MADDAGRGGSAPIGRRLRDSRDDSAARGRWITLLASASIVAFSTNALWTQDLSTAESARTVGQSSGELLEVVSEQDSALQPEVETLLGQSYDNSKSNDIQAELLESSTDVEAAVMVVLGVVLVLAGWLRRAVAVAARAPLIPGEAPLIPGDS